MIFLLQLSITAIALFVTYASVLGLGALFATIAYPVMGAGIALELGKYVSVSYAYQQWSVLGRLERTLLVFFVTLMMAFTSAGVFSYLGQSYQSSYADLDARKAELVAVTAQSEAVAKRVATIEAQISNLPSNIVSGRIRLMREYEAERTPLVNQLTQLNAKVAELQQVVATAEIHAGPITYIAQATGTTVAQSATWIILALTVCLDPFALFLTVLMNKLLMLRKKKTEDVVAEPVKPPAFSSPLPEIIETEVLVAEESPAVPEVSTASAVTFPPLDILYPHPVADVETTDSTTVEPEVAATTPIVAEQPAALQSSMRERVTAKKPAVKKVTPKKAEQASATTPAKRVRKKPEPKVLPKVDLPVANLASTEKV